MIIILNIVHFGQIFLGHMKKIKFKNFASTKALNKFLISMIIRTLLTTGIIPVVLLSGITSTVQKQINSVNFSLDRK